MVRRFVQQEGVGAAEQDPGQLDAPPLATGQRAQRLAQHTLREAEACGHRRSLRLSGVAAEHVQPLLCGAVSLDRSLVARGHLVLRGAKVRHHDVHTAPRQDSVACEHFEVAGARVLRQVADGASAVDRATGRQTFTGEYPRERRLARAVAADESDSVAVGDPEGRSFEE